MSTAVQGVLTQAQDFLNSAAQSVGLSPPFPVTPAMGATGALPGSTPAPSATVHPGANLLLLGGALYLAWRYLK